MIPSCFFYFVLFYLFMIAAVRDMSRIHFFWHANENNGEFSQWYRCRFTEDGITYNCAEQYMMYHKMMLMGNRDAALRILEAKTPREQKSLGRGGGHWDEILWLENREKIVAKGNMLKFTQNPRLLRKLLDTGDDLIAEASPHDAIWGIGLREYDRRASKVETWIGLNLLGYVLMDVRDRLRKESSQSFLYNA
jgi:hypothetical protein